MNTANILKDKPKGTKLYSLIDGELILEFIASGDNSIHCKNKYGIEVGFRENGHYYNDNNNDGECLLFPSKQMRDWNKFQWKKGDVLIGQNGEAIIFTEWSNNSYTLFNGVYHQCYDGMVAYDKTEKLKTNYYSKASDKTARNFIKQLENEHSGKLNLSTLEIEKQPKFKDGDIVYTELKSGYKAVSIFQRFLCQNRPATYVDFFLDEEKPILADYDDGYNILCESEDIAKMKLATEEEKNLLLSKLASIGKKWNPDTKQIEDLPKPQHKLKPFQKVLIRDTGTDKWRANIFSHYEESDPEYPHICMCGDWKQCIPYEGNEHLLGTTDSPKEGGE